MAITTITVKRGEPVGVNTFTLPGSSAFRPTGKILSGKLPEGVDVSPGWVENKLAIVSPFFNPVYGFSNWLTGTPTSADGTFSATLEVAWYRSTGSSISAIAITVIVKGQVAGYSGPNSTTPVVDPAAVKAAEDAAKAAQTAAIAEQILVATYSHITWPQAIAEGAAGSRIRRINWSDRFLEYKNSLWFLQFFNPTTKILGTRRVVVASDWSEEQFRATDWTTDGISGQSATAGSHHAGINQVYP